MNISFNKKSIPKLEKKGLSQFTIKTVHVGGWAGPREQPVVAKGRPKNEESYKKIQQEGFTFFVEKELAKELEGKYVELASYGIIFPRYIVSLVKDMDEK